jgi:hypothetical protein
MVDDEMRKKTVIAGIIILVIGASLFIYLDYAPSFWRTSFDDSDTILESWYWRFENFVDSGEEVISEYTASDEIEFFVLDSENFELFLERYKEGERYTFFSAIYHSVGISDSYTFRAPKDDTYYAILMNDGDQPVTASFKQLEESYTILGVTGFSSIICFIIGAVALIGGLIQKPKNAEPSLVTQHNETS